MRPSLTPINPHRAAQVREAAVQLFAENGYPGTTINDIADVLGIRGPSLYKHVSSKQQILREIVIGAMDDLLALQRQATAASDAPTEQLRGSAYALASYHVEHSARAFVCVRELNSLEDDARAEVQVRRDALWHGLRDLLRAGIAAGEFRLEDDQTAVMTFCLIELISSPATWYVEGRASRTQVADAIAAASLRLAAARGS